MILHLGGEFCCFFEDVLFVLKADGCTQNAQTARFLQGARESGRMVVIDEKQVKSYVVTSAPNGAQRIFASPISAATLQKRAEKAAER